MSRHLSILSNVIIVLQVFLLLFCFVDLSGIPYWVRYAGKFHPLLLHLPITMVLLMFPLGYVAGRNRENTKLTNLLQTLLGYTTLLATLTSLAGLLLATGGDYYPSTLSYHKWSGVAIALISNIMFLGFGWLGQKRVVWNTLLGVTGCILLVGSHWGGSLTHGEEFLAFKPEGAGGPEPKEINEKTSVYSGAIEPIFEAKCKSCHNDNKMKGGLNLSSFQAAFKGGKSGAAWLTGNPEHSLMMERILLDLTDKKHMPPKGKAQLNADEILLFKEWIKSGGDNKLTILSVPEKDSLRLLLSRLVQQPAAETKTKSYAFSAASSSTIQQLNSPFRRILPLASNSPALVVKFFLKEKYTLDMLKECKPISEQVIEINLSNMPANDDAIEVLSTFENLERLVLNGTSITGKNLKALSANKKLEQISLTGTAVDRGMMAALGNIPSLKKVFLWNTKVSPEEKTSLSKEFPKIQWDFGFIPDKNELLKLTPPVFADAEKRILSKEELISFKKPMPGVQIRYTTDGSNPDSALSTLYTKPFPATGMTRVRAIAYSTGWLTSDTTDNTFFLKGYHPDSVHLVNPPDPQYQADGGSTLTDFIKGSSGNLKVSWLGFRDKSFKAFLNFSHGEEIKEILISAVENTDAYVMPPRKIIIKGGLTPTSMKVIKTIVPEQPQKHRGQRLTPFVVPLEKNNFTFFEIEAVPVTVLPKWHRGAGDKGWVFVDEIFFY